MRGRLPVMLAFTIGLGALLWGASSLERIFRQERDDARAAISARRQALEQYAGQAMAAALREAMEDQSAVLEAAARDPLMPEGGLLLVRAGERVLPRNVVSAPGDGRPARDLFERLRTRGARAVLSEAEAGSPWAVRLDSMRRLEAAIAADHRAGIESAVRAIAAHRSRYVVPATLDAPFLLALVERLQRGTRPAPELMRMLLRDGTGPGPEPSVLGLQRMLLLRRDRFTRPDFAFLRERVLQLSLEANVRHDDFRERTDEPAVAVPPVPDSLPGPALLAGGRWYVEPFEPGAVRGIAVDPDALLEAIRLEMRERGLIGATDTVELDFAAGPVSMIEAGAPVPVRSPEWTIAERDIAGRYRLKSALGVALGFLAAATIGMGFLVQSREQRFLRLKSHFVATVSHELRTPLASMRVVAETLHRRFSGTDAARDYPARLLKEIDSLDFVVENILSFHRLEKGRWTPRREPVPLRTLVTSLQDELASTGSKPLRIDAGALDGTVLDADPGLLKLLFLNLGRNAAAYNARDPVELSFRAARENGAVSVEVSDNGIGIPEDEQEKIFAEFYRPDATSRSSRGSGLGLAICRRAMEAHGGTIRVLRSGPEGTTFELSFPDPERST